MEKVQDVGKGYGKLMQYTYYYIYYILLKYYFSLIRYVIITYMHMFRNEH